MNYVIQCAISVDSRPCALLTITNVMTGTEAAPDYRVSLARYRERDTLITYLKAWDRIDKQRIDLVADAFRALAYTEAAHVTTT